MVSDLRSICTSIAFDCNAHSRHMSGSTIPGLEEAVQGMTPGGIRRLLIPSKLAYQSASTGIREECEGGKGLGPIPPASELGEFQRFKNIYCNPDRVYQPDLVLDVKLYGKR